MTEEEPIAAAPERLTRWRLILGAGEADGVTSGGASIPLGDDDAVRDRVLGDLYDADRSGGIGRGRPQVSRWLGDIRTYFPSSVVQVMQGDAMERLGLRQMLLEPEMMRAVQPDVNLVSTLIGLSGVIPAHSRETARAVVRHVTSQLEERLAARTIQAVTGAINRASRTNRPKFRDVDWNRTIAANLKNYLPEHRTVVPERLVGNTRRRSQVQQTIILCIDQSGSMAESVVYSAVFGAVLASLRTVKTHLVVFDTDIVDLTDEIDDPVDVLFGVQLGGGTDINGALAYCQGLITQPTDTVVVLISDLYEGAIAEEMLRRADSIVGSGATMVALLALSDSGRPSFDEKHANALSAIGVPAFACTPDLFPELMAAAIQREDVGAWAAANDIVTTHGEPDAT